MDAENMQTIETREAPAGGAARVAVRSPRRNLIEGLVFCMLVAAMLLATNAVFKPARRANGIGNPWGAYHSLDQRSVDVVFFGTSHAFTGVDPIAIWRAGGIPTFVLGGPVQRLEVTRFYVRESLRTQKPKVIALEMVAAAYPDKKYDKNFHQLNVGYMPLTTNRVRAALQSTPPEDRTGVLLDLWLYHSRWPELKRGDLNILAKNKGFEYLRGFIPLAESKPVTAKPSPLLQRPLPSELPTRVAANMPELREIAKTCEENDVELLLMLSPTGPPGQYSYYLRSAGADLKKDFPNVRVLDLSLPGAVEGLSYETDFSDGGHLNYRGAEKAGAALAKFLGETYGLRDRRGEPAYREWDADGVKHDEYVAKLERETKAKAAAKKQSPDAQEKPAPKK